MIRSTVLMSLLQQTPPRRGAMLVLVSALIVVLLAMTLFTVDVAYMQLTRSELRAASDAAAKAGAEALRRTKDVNQARAAVKSVASKNTIGGRPLVIRDDEIEFGSVELQSNGSWEFDGGSTPYTAVRVDAQMGGNSDNDPVQLFFADFFGDGSFEPARTSTAAHTAVEICLCIDRSHSMCFDMTGVDWKYPNGGTKSTDYLKPPHPSQSRWGVLMKAAAAFVTVLQSQNPTPRVGVVTWGSQISGGGLTFPASIIDLPLSTIHGNINNKLTSKSLQIMLGATNMSAGINQAVGVLADPGVDPLATKIMILMSDGQWNQGSDPLQTAQQAKAQGIVIHTISFLSSGNEATLQAIADITGGKAYSADNETELKNAFISIARQLPVVLTD
jgi:Ca-activated chloride channel family protein